MPAFGGRLGDADIWAVLAFIKSTWPPEIRAAQAARNGDPSGLSALTGDQRLPADCRPLDTDLNTSPNTGLNTDRP